MEASGSWMDEIDFPATKVDLIDAASDAGAPQEAVERLQQLSNEQYESRQELEAELSGGA
jgi:Protein of unknown function (DUF2795)